MMQYILIDLFGGIPNISLKEPELPYKYDEGTCGPLIYDTLEEAETAVDTECQNGIVVPLAHTIPVLKKCALFLDGLEEKYPIVSLLKPLVDELIE